MDEKEGEGTEPVAPTSTNAAAVEEYNAPAVPLSGEIREAAHQDLQKSQHSTSTEHSSGTSANVSVATTAVTSADTFTDTETPKFGAPNLGQTKMVVLKISRISKDIVGKPPMITSPGMWSIWLISFTVRSPTPISAVTRKRISDEVIKLTLLLLKKRVAEVTSTAISEDIATIFKKTTTNLTAAMTTDSAANASSTDSDTLLDFRTLWRVNVVTAFPKPVAIATAEMAAEMVFELTLPALSVQLLAATTATSPCSVTITPGPPLEIIVIGVTLASAEPRNTEKEVKKEAAAISQEIFEDTEKNHALMSFAEKILLPPSACSSLSNVRDLEMEQLRKAELEKMVPPSPSKEQ